jgi:hypothetical protein
LGQGNGFQISQRQSQPTFCFCACARLFCCRRRPKSENQAALGLFFTLNDPTREMEKEAASAVFYETEGMKVPRLQILTAAQILDNRRPQVPFGFTEGFKKAAREEPGQERLI